MMHRRKNVVGLATLAGVAAISSSLALPALQATASPTTVYDDFDGTELDTQVWSTVDPLGDGVFTVDGGQLQIDVPAGTAHNPWDAADVPRAVHHVPDGDITTEAKFDSIHTQQYQMSGLLFEQDPTTFTRFEIHHDGTELRLFASATVNGTGTSHLNTAIPDGSTIYLRVTRTGDTWDFDWSTDGTTWQTGTTFTQPLTLTRTGTYAGNATGTDSPAHTTTADYISHTYEPDTTDPTPEPTAEPTTEPDPTESTVYDNFDGTELDTQVWSTVNPLGDGTFAVESDQLLIDVPTGTEHNPWDSADVPRAVHQVPDGDITVEAKFDTIPAQGYQMSGLLFEQDPATFARFEIYHDGSDLRLFASATNNGDGRSKLNTAIPDAATIHLRVTRTGDSWAFDWSTDGTTWQSGTTFTQQLNLNQVGPYAGNGLGTNSPAHTTAIDHISYTYEPGDTGDSGDPDNPDIVDVTVAVSDLSAAVEWTTNVATSGSVDYGTTTSYGSTVNSAVSSTSHNVVLNDLVPETTYHYRVNAANGDGATAEPVTGTFTTSPSGDGIDIWYGQDQTFGAPSQSQRWVNILGSVSDPDAITSLTYRLNAGNSTSLNIGPDGRRLQDPGDFNVDIAYNDLNVGANTVAVTATWGDTSSTRSVTVNVVESAPLSLPYTQSWTSSTPLQQQAAVVDGQWTVADGAVRSEQLGYDRLIALGDQTWTDYDVLVPFTVHGLADTAYSPLSGAPVVGIGTRWQGHTHRKAHHQPGWDWFPAGAYAWYRFYESGGRWELTGNDNSPFLQGSSAPFIPFSTEYLMRVRVETLTDATRYSIKMWPSDAPEPDSWDGTIEDSDGLAAGSIVLIAHQLDATFGDVVVTEVPAQ